MPARPQVSCVSLALAFSLRYGVRMSPAKTPLLPPPPVATGPLVEAIDRSLAAALGGDDGAAAAYTRAWRALVRLLVRSEAPDTEPALADVLDLMALEAPFSPWLATFGPGEGAALLLQARIRSAAGLGVPAEPVAGTSFQPDLDRLDLARFARHVWLELQGGEGELARLAASWRLSQTDLARLFGVKRQAVAQWLEDGVPPARQPKVLTIVRIAELLERNLRAERIPAVVRSPAEALGGTMLEVIAADRQDELLSSVARSFDWSAGV